VRLLDALEYLHSQSPPIIHRDIKPANIKLSPRGEVILLDFGISKGGKTSTTHLTMSGSSIQAYSPTYAPLEQIEGQGTDERSDLYSLGITLHHLLTGAVPSTAITRASAQIHNTLIPCALPTASRQSPSTRCSLKRVEASHHTKSNPTPR
jgi:serine/threonine protein kinase